MLNLLTIPANIFMFIMNIFVPIIVYLIIIMLGYIFLYQIFMIFEKFNNRIEERMFGKDKIEFDVDSDIEASFDKDYGCKIPFYGSDTDSDDNSDDNLDAYKDYDVSL